MLTRILTGLVGVPIVVWLLHSGGMLLMLQYLYWQLSAGWNFIIWPKIKAIMFLFFVRYYDLGAGRKFDVFG